MLRQQRVWSAQRISAVGVVIVAVIAAAVAVTIILYQLAIADQVDAAAQQIREAADQLATEQAQWATTSERLEKLVDEIETALREGAGELAHELR
ncbi:MAG: hypothetical protein ACRDOU_26395 [Streptosporangiaceae bacterium]